jgi:hypothetical protein
MSQQQKLEKVLDLLLSEDSDQAAELLHQIIVEKARDIYESIVEEEDKEDVEEKKDVEESVEEESDEVGGEPSKDFTDEIGSDKEEVESDEENDGEAGEGEAFDDEEDKGEEGEGAPEGDVEERVEDLETQLAELRAEFDALMGEEFEEPQHADLPGKMDDIGAEFGGEEEEGAMPDFGGEEKVVGEVVAQMFEKKGKEKLEKAPEAKDKKKDKKVEEETQFLKKTPDTGQKSANPGFAGTGKNTPKGAEQTKSVETKAPPKPNYGGKPDNILGGGPLGGEYGKWKGESAKDETPSDNVDEKLKKSGTGGMDKTEGKFSGTGAKSQTGATQTKSPLTKAPHKLMPTGGSK